MMGMMEAAIGGVAKRDGREAEWDLRKVQAAVLAAMAETGEGGAEDSVFVGRSVESALLRAARAAGGQIRPHVEAVQDEVERQLMLHGFAATAKAYILYRDRRARERGLAYSVPQEARDAAAASRPYFEGNALGEFVYHRTYSRFVPEVGRRESWLETARRYVAFMQERLGTMLEPYEYQECEQAILSMESMPSMRLLWSAGAAARATNAAAYNCAYVAPSALGDFGEILYLSACGCGVGFSAESANVQRLPVVARQRYGKGATHLVEDSKEGWARALSHGLELWFDGADLDFDFRAVRPEGARLRTMGGRASGPGPLADLLNFARRLALSRQGRRLSNLDVHDLVCKTGEAIVSGGVRRTALISLSDLDDDALRDAKSGHFFLQHAHRSLANNSAVYEARPPAAQFMREWLALAESGSGERGIFNRGGIAAQVPERRVRRWAEMGLVSGDGTLLAQVGTNPCGEIYLLSKQFCNLTEAVCRAEDSPRDLLRKVRIAALLGTYQSTLTDFPYLSREWKENCERERLLGVSLTGQRDCRALREDRDGSLLRALRAEAVRTNDEYADRFGIPASSAVTCGKPSGTLSQMVGSSSGGHDRFAPFYVRRVRISATDPLFRMLRDQGVAHEPENGQQRETANTFVFSFPCRSPEGAPVAGDSSAVEQLDRWLSVKRSFTEHNPSVTIYVGDDEWVPVGEWVWRNWLHVGGLSFLPRQDHVYRQAPYEEITEAEYEAMVAAQRPVDYSLLAAYERDDETQGAKELACAGGACEL